MKLFFNNSFIFIYFSSCFCLNFMHTLFLFPTKYLKEKENIFANLTVVEVALNLEIQKKIRSNNLNFLTI